MSSNSGPSGTGGGAKLSFAFGAGPGSTKTAGNGNAAGASTSNGASGSSSGAKSNMEALMAKARAKSGGSALASIGGPGKGSAAAAASKGRMGPPASLFGDDEDDEDDNGGSGPSTNTKKGTTKKGRPDLLFQPMPKPSSSITSATTATQLSRSAAKQRSAALSLDPTTFQYDEVYDDLKSAEAARDAVRKAENDSNKPKYMDSFLASAETRKLDRLRAEEKMLALEREKEGGEFDDKEKFVTEGYKKQMEEVRKAEEEEKKREEAMRKSGKGPGLSAFYKTMLDVQGGDRDSAIASATTHGNAAPSLAIKPPTQQQQPQGPAYEPEAEYDPLLAREAASASASTSSGPRNKPPREARLPILRDDDEEDEAYNGQRTGGAGPGRLGPSRPERLGDDDDDDDESKVQINDEGEVVNKRALLRAGLNITAKPSTLPSSLFSGGSGSNGGAGAGGAYVSKAVGSAAGYQDRMARERARLAENMRLEAERKKKAEEDRLAEEEEKARRRREGDDGMAEKRRREAKERFLERKRAREAGGSGSGSGEAKGKDEGPDKKTKT